MASDPFALPSSVVVSFGVSLNLSTLAISPAWLTIINNDRRRRFGCWLGGRSSGLLSIGAAHPVVVRAIGLFNSTAAVSAFGVSSSS